MATEIRSFNNAQEFMAKSRNAYYRKLHSTLQVEKLANSHPFQDRYGIRYYATVIVKYYDGFVTLNSGGYRSSFTNKLLNKYGPENVRVWQKNYRLYVNYWEGDEIKTTEFFDGITFTTDGRPANFSVQELEIVNG